MSQKKEAKYRAWDNKQKKYEYWSAKENKYDGIFWEMIKRSEFEEPEESTGLKDKSVEVVEVWKGDLLESRYFPGTLEVDQITEGHNSGQWIAKQEDGGYQDLFEALTVDLYEVIGNIHSEK